MPHHAATESILSTFRFRRNRSYTTWLGWLSIGEALARCRINGVEHEFTITLKSPAVGVDRIHVVAPSLGIEFRSDRRETVVRGLCQHVSYRRRVRLREWRTAYLWRVDGVEVVFDLPRTMSGPCTYRMVAAQQQSPNRVHLRLLNMPEANREDAFRLARFSNADSIPCLNRLSQVEQLTVLVASAIVLCWTEQVSASFD